MVDIDQWIRFCLFIDHMCVGQKIHMQKKRKKTPLKIHAFKFSVPSDLI